jgi:hypothetical protein
MPPARNTLLAQYTLVISSTLEYPLLSQLQVTLCRTVAAPCRPEQAFEPVISA